MNDGNDRMDWVIWVCVIILGIFSFLAANGCMTSGCEGPAPDCDYGRTPVCYEGKWFCAADHDVFAQACDEDCAPNDPICIPCDLGDYA